MLENLSGKMDKKEKKRTMEKRRERSQKRHIVSGSLRPTSSIKFESDISINILRVIQQWPMKNNNCFKGERASEGAQRQHLKYPEGLWKNWVGYGARLQGHGTY